MQPISGLLVRAAPLLELDDCHQLLTLILRDGDRRDAAPGDLLDRRLDVVGIVVTPIHDQQILDAANDEQLALGYDGQITSPKPVPPRRAGRWIDEPPTEGLFRQLRVPPVALRHVVAVHPDLPYL